MSDAIKDPRVDAYLAPLPDWQREIFGRVRDLLHEADPQVQETIKRTVQPYFVLDGNIATGHRLLAPPPRSGRRQN